MHIQSWRAAHLVAINPPVINISSMYGIVSPDLRIYSSELNANPPFYGAAKAALIQFTKYSTCEFGLKILELIPFHLALSQI